MKITPLSLDGLLLCEPVRHGDSRGWFMESYRQDRLDDAAGRAVRFVQDNQSFSAQKGTLRGMHYQAPPRAQAKLIRCLSGSLTDVVVDARRASSTYGQSISVSLSADNGRQLFVPAGYLHGFVTTAPDTMVAYKVTDIYSAEHEGSVRWDSLGIDWPLGDGQPQLSDRDRAAPTFADWLSPFD